MGALNGIKAPENSNETVLKAESKELSENEELNNSNDDDLDFDFDFSFEESAIEFETNPLSLLLNTTGAEEIIKSLETPVDKEILSNKLGCYIC